MTAIVRAFIAMGSNLGDREAHLAFARLALRAHPQISVRACAPIIETDPVGPVEQGRFLNTVVEVETSLEPRELLDLLLSIERRRGRVRSPVATRWGPRTLDLDLLLYGDRVIDEPGLTVPHPRLHNREFVLEPLCAIAPKAVHPQLGRTIHDLLARLKRSELRERDPL